MIGAFRISEIHSASHKLGDVQDLDEDDDQPKRDGAVVQGDTDLTREEKQKLQQLLAKNPQLRKELQLQENKFKVDFSKVDAKKDLQQFYKKRRQEET
mmetsp:Transcript_26013/g.39827  ORF Transcript_26013/g.39827 Transcript_26013/m.39827 type:complete len:98 (+) Transcript_26013:906-1199(+)